jgi:hemerythrin
VWTQFEQYNKDAAAPIGLPRFLKKWLLNHIAVKDKRYAAFITKH